MFAKSAILAALCLVALSLALPNPHHHDHGDHADNGAEHHKGGERHHNKSHEHYQLNPNSPFQKLKNITSYWYSEFFIVASGDHFHSPEVPKETHIAANAIVLLSQKLHAMPQVYKLLANTSADFALNGAKVDEKDTMVKFVNELVAHIQKSSSLSAEFETIKSGLSDSFISHGKFFKPDSASTPELRDKAIAEWAMSPFMRAAILNRMFYTKSFHHEHSGMIAKALIDQSINDPEIHEKLEKMYADAVAKTIEVACPGHEKEKAENLLFTNLMDLFSEDGPLAVKLLGDRKLLLLNHYVLW